MTLLLGSTGLGIDGSDFEGTGREIGSKYVCLATGTVNTITFRRSAAAGTSNSIKAAVFTNNSSTPGTVIGNVVDITTTNTTAFFTSAGDANAPVTVGSTYWLVFLAVNGTGELDFRTFDGSGGSGGTAGGTKEETNTGRSTIASTWGGTLAAYAEIISAYAEGTVPAADNTTKPALPGMWDTEIVSAKAWF